MTSSTPATTSAGAAMCCQISVQLNTPRLPSCYPVSRNVTWKVRYTLIGSPL